MATPVEIRKWMKLHHISQVELARQVHCSRPTIYRLLAGKKVQDMVLKSVEALMQQDDNINLRMTDNIKHGIDVMAARWNCTRKEAAYRLLATALKIAGDFQPMSMDSFSDEPVSEAAEDTPPD